MKSSFHRLNDKPFRVMRAAGRGEDAIVPIGMKKISEAELAKRLRPLVGLAATGHISVEDPQVREAVGRVLDQEYRKLAKE